MPRYYFHVHNSINALDREGVEFPDLDSAKKFAIAGARDLIGDEIRLNGRLTFSHSIEIVDAHGATLHVTRFADCVTIEP